MQDQLHRIERQLSLLLDVGRLILGTLNNILTGELKVSQQLDTLTAQVTANTSAEQSAITLLNNLHQLLVDAGTDPAKLGALADTLKSSGDALAAAVVANTPAA